MSTPKYNISSAPNETKKKRRKTHELIIFRHTKNNIYETIKY